MVIEKEQLILLLQKKTNLDQEQVEAQISELVDQIQDAVKQGKPLQVDELGTFGVSNGKLQFVPDNKLAMEVNTKYAGMKPIELIGAFKESDTAEIPVSDHSDDIEAEEHIDPLTFEEESSKPEPTDKRTAEEEPASEDEQKEEQAEEELQPKPDPIPAHSETKPDEPKPKPKAAKKAQPKKKTAAASQKDTVGRLVTAIVAVLAIAIIGWFAYDLGYIGSHNTNKAEQSLSSQTAPKPETKASKPQRDNNEADSLQNVNPKNNKEASDTKPKVTQDEQTSAQKNKTATTEEGKNGGYGLKGKIVPDIGKAYMIVVHSRRQIDSARKNKQELEAKGYRTTINRTDINGKTQFRVGIGQFQSIKDAQQGITTLPEPYKSNNFITRIR